MRTDELLPEGATTVRHCETVTEAGLLMQDIVERGADARDLVLLAHAPTPLPAPEPARPAWWLVAVPVAAGVLGGLAGGARGAVLVALSFAVLIAVTRPRASSPQRLLVASSYDLVAKTSAAARTMTDAGAAVTAR